MAGDPLGRPTRAGSVGLRPRSFDRWTALHVTLRILPGLRTLRGCKTFRAIHRALCSGNERPDFRLVEYSVQTTHFHLLVESPSTQSLTRGVQGLAIRLARSINRTFCRSGTVFRDRYCSRVMTGSRDARDTLRYVLNNARRHVRCARRNQTRWTDPCSSAPWFRKWSIPRHAPAFVPDQRYFFLTALGSAAVPPRTPLLASGWSRAGPIDLLHIPGPQP
ncbi:MAG: transposase [Polyangiaceae bacterium]|nr:transposase [Polyangiaceae bacterium]